MGIPEKKSTYGPAAHLEEFWRSDLQCRGDEESLEDPGCARGEVAGVTCYLRGKFIFLNFFSEFKSI